MGENGPLESPLVTSPRSTEQPLTLNWRMDSTLNLTPTLTAPTFKDTDDDPTQ